MTELHYKKDGTLDMRYKSSKELVDSQKKIELDNSSNDQNSPQNSKEISKPKSEIQKEAPKTNKEESKVQKEESQIQKEESKTKKEETKTRKEETKTKKEETKTKKEETKTKKEETKTKKEETKTKKEESKPLKKKTSITTKEEHEDPSSSPIISPLVSRDIPITTTTYISPKLSLQPTELYTSSDIRLTQEGFVDLSSKAVKLGDIKFNADGTVDKSSNAVLTGRLILNSKGNPDVSFHKDVRIPKNPGDYKTKVYRDNYQQRKFRKETDCPKDYDASHIVDLELAREILKSKPGRHPTEDELHQAMKPLNKLLEARPQTVNRQNQLNPENDREMVKRIIKILHGEQIIKTRALELKIVQMRDALHSIPQEEMNPHIKYIMNQIDRIAPHDVE